MKTAPLVLAAVVVVVLFIYPGLVFVASNQAVRLAVFVRDRVRDLFRR